MSEEPTLKDDPDFIAECREEDRQARAEWREDDRDDVRGEYRRSVR